MASPPVQAPPPRPNSGQILLRGYGYLRPYWRPTVSAYLLVLGITGLALLIPQVERWIVDRGIQGGDTRLLGWSVLGLLGPTFLKGVLAFAQGRWTAIASQSVCPG